MKKLIISVIFLLSLTTTYSQDTTKLPVPIAKQVIKDLLSGDSAKAELKLTKEALDSTEKKVIAKDTAISIWRDKYRVCGDNLRTEKTKVSLLGEHITKLEKDKKLLTFGVGLFILTTLFALLK